MKWAFTFLLCIHGIIHLIGFAKALFSTEIDKQVVGIPKIIGSLWLICFIIFIATAVSLFNIKKWFYIAIVAVCLSQILIILFWKEAKYGTIVNLIILLLSISALGNYRFNKMVQKEAMVLFQNFDSINSSLITRKELSHLPDIIQKWIINSGVIGKKNIFSVRLKQKGEMRTKPNTRWMPFTAKQYFNVEMSAFVWVTEVKYKQALYMVGRDKLFNGNASMLIKLFALIPVVKERENNTLNSGTMQRYLSEICWFPSAALSHYIKWETIDSTSAKAILTINNKSVSGIFKFTDEGDLIAFETNRYFGGKEDAKLEKWVVNITDYKVFNGYKTPYKCEVIWKFKSGDFNWLNLEITDIEYNKLSPYGSQ